MVYSVLIHLLLIKKKLIMKKFIIKKILAAPDLSTLERKILKVLKDEDLSDIVSECTLPLGEEQELIVAKRCFETDIMRCITMLRAPSKDVLKILTDRQMYLALSVANLESLDMFSADSILDNPQTTPALRMRIISECKISDSSYKKHLEEKGNHLELLLYLGNKQTSKVYPSQVKFFLKRNDKNEIEAMIAKGLAPDAWYLLLENTDWKAQAFERLEKEPLSKWATEVGKFIFTKGSAADKDNFMQIFCEKYKSEKTILPSEVMRILISNREFKHLISYFEVGGMVEKPVYQLLIEANVPEVIQAMKTWPTHSRIQK